MGFENRPASGEELERMKRLLEETLQADAIGLSLGLMYSDRKKFLLSLARYTGVEDIGRYRQIAVNPARRENR